MANIVYIATSIDGYIAREDGSIDWLMEVPDNENEDYGFSEFMERIDGIVMGRKTFETAIGFGQWLYTKPVFVLSRTMDRVPDVVTGKAAIIQGNPGEIIAALREKGFRNLYIDGGQTIQEFLRQDMIDEIIITRIPVLLGSGIPLFGSIEKDLKFKHVETTTYQNSLVKTRYIRQG